MRGNFCEQIKELFFGMSLCVSLSLCEIVINKPWKWHKDVYCFVSNRAWPIYMCFESLRSVCVCVCVQRRLIEKYEPKVQRHTTERREWCSLWCGELWGFSGLIWKHRSVAATELELFEPKVVEWMVYCSKRKLPVPFPTTLVLYNKLGEAARKRTTGDFFNEKTSALRRGIGGVLHQRKEFLLNINW